jgi:putative oxidoreductase
MSDIGLLILRLTVGLIMTAHGAQKLVGWFDGPGIENWSSIMGRMGVRPAAFWAWLNALAEVVGGLMLAIGLLTPVAAAMLAAVLAMAIVKVHWRNGFFTKNSGVEFPLSLLASLIAVGLSGPGAYALAPLSLLGWSPTTLFLVLLTAGLLADGVALTTTALNTKQGRPA